MPAAVDFARLHEQLLGYLRRTATCTAEEARRQLKISQPTFSRLVQQARHELLVVGRASATRYAARRELSGLGRTLPIYEIDEKGGSRRLALLHATWPDDFYVEPLTADCRGGFFADLPYFLDDLRPQGFLGRVVPRRHPELKLPSDIRHWTAGHCLSYLAHHGWDLPGNLIIGDAAFEAYLRGQTQPIQAIPRADRSARYAAIADDVLALPLAGSSAGGEQPKFLAYREGEHGPRAVLVKFSPHVTEASGRRVADLLVAEQLALDMLRQVGHSAAESEVVLGHDGRVYLEVCRFDRESSGGRRGLISMLALDAEYSGKLSGWLTAATALEAEKLLSREDLNVIHFRELFGTMIGNDDMHLGNLSFFTRGTAPIGVAPTYDMLPMRYMPRHGHVPNQPLPPLGPTAKDGPFWGSACDAAVKFWRAVAADPRVSEPFRAIARANCEMVERTRELESKLPRGS